LNRLLLSKNNFLFFPNSDAVEILQFKDGLAFAILRNRHLKKLILPTTKSPLLKKSIENNEVFIAFTKAIESMDLILAALEENQCKSMTINLNTNIECSFEALLPAFHPNQPLLFAPLSIFLGQLLAQMHKFQSTWLRTKAMEIVHVGSVLTANANHQMNNNNNNTIPLSTLSMIYDHKPLMKMLKQYKMTEEDYDESRFLQSELAYE
jgi:hypothetical protein